MALPPNVRINAAVPFPARVIGAGTVKLVKTNGNWVISLDYTAVAEAAPTIGDYPATRILVWNSATGVYTTLSMTDLQLATQAGLQCALEYVFDASGQPLQPRIGYLKVPFNMTITEIAALLDQSGSMTFDIWRCTQAQFDPPTRPVIGDSLFTTEPAIVAAKKYDDTTLTGVTTRLNAGDVLGFCIISAVTATRATIALFGVRLQAGT